MTVNFTRKTASTATIDTESLKEFCRVSHTLEDALFQLWFSAAIAHIENLCGFGLLTQTWQLSMSSMPRTLVLPKAAPLQSVTFVKYYDDTNVQQTLSASNYYLPAFTSPARLELATTATIPGHYDRPDAWQIEYIVGVTSPELLPVPLQLAIRMLVAHWHEHREPVLVGTISSDIQMTVESLCYPYRLWWEPPV